MVATLDARTVTADAPAPPRTVGRIAVLDGLRLVSAVSVAFFHFAGCALVAKAWDVHPKNLFPVIYPFASYGWLGVELFFMISGFVICMSAWGRTVGAFARSRIVRLFPAYWPAVLLTTAVMTFWPVIHNRLPADQVLVNLTMVNTPLGIPNVDNVYWTLWGETRFYLLFAVLLAWRGLSLRSTTLFGYGWLVAGALSVNSGLPILRMVFQPENAPLFVAGIAFYLIYRFGDDLKLWGMVAFAYALEMHNVVIRIDYTSKVNHSHLSHGIGMIVVTAYFVILGVIARGWTDRIRWRWLTTAGLLTYPFYLIHQVVGWSVIDALHDLRPRKLTLALTILAMLLVAWLLHRLLERPLARLIRRKLTSAASTQPATVTPHAGRG
jgi:peptidoglycan/LPS O-acetylase OafA/YrhL